VLKEAVKKEKLVREDENKLIVQVTSSPYLLGYEPTLSFRLRSRPALYDESLPPYVPPCEFPGLFRLQAPPRTFEVHGHIPSIHRVPPPGVYGASISMNGAVAFMDDASPSAECACPRSPP